MRAAAMGLVRHWATRLPPYGLSSQAISGRGPVVQGERQPTQQRGHEPTHLTGAKLPPHASMLRHIARPVVEFRVGRQIPVRRAAVQQHRRG